MSTRNRSMIPGIFLAAVLLPSVLLAGEPPAIPAETPQQARWRHERVAERRRGVDIICHRGASEHAHENTLEAFRATFELGGDGNEFDIRKTRDGVLVVFHDDMLDRLLDAYGDVGDYTWDELQRFRFRNPGRFGDQCRIPTLVEVFELHRRYGGLMHLHIKRDGLDQAIAELLTRMEMWDHVGYCNPEDGGVILRDPRLRLRRYKAGLYLDRGEVFPDAIAAALAQPGDGVIVDDPRGVAAALGRTPGQLSREPVARRKVIPAPVSEPPRDEAKLLAILRNASDWNRVVDSPSDRAASGQAIRARARAAEQLLAIRASSQEAYAALEERVRRRSLHKDWMFHGFDGAMALRSLILLRAPNAVEMARFVLWRDDPALEPLMDPRWKNPRAWTDFRVKMVVWPALEHCPGPATERLCRDYLALDDAAARAIGPPQFEEAGKTLLAVSPRRETAIELMRHRLQAVRGRAVLDCLAHANEEWARSALEAGGPNAQRPRIIIETDAGGDPDDEQSLVRFLLYANDWDVEGIIANRPHTSRPENKNPEDTGLGIVRRLIDAYGACYPNLARHDSRYPRPEVLASRTVPGYDDTDAAVKLLIAAVDRADPRPVWYADWGTNAGGSTNNLKRALDRVRAERGPDGYAAFKAKLRVVCHGNVFGDHATTLDPPFPLLLDTFRPALDGKRWYHRFSALTATAGGFDLTRDVLTGHGALGALYPTNTTHPQKEGDTMTFLYLIPNGLGEPEKPGWGSWAGRYGPNPEFGGRPCYWANQADAWQGTTNRDNTVRRWADQIQNDFRARLEWCVRPAAEASHPPRLVVNGVAGSGAVRVMPAASTTLALSASGSRDPDGRRLAFEWFVYPEAGTYPSPVRVDPAAYGAATVRVPADAAGKEIHVIVAATGDGPVRLTRYRRVVIAPVKDGSHPSP